MDLAAVLVRATPLLLLGLAVALAFRAGVWNIGAEGQFYAGAVVAAAIGTSLPIESRLAGWLILLPAALAAGMIWAAIPALLRLRFGVLEVITTIMLNFVAEHLVGWLVHGPLQESARTYPQSDAIGEGFRLAPLLAGTRVTLAFPAAVVLAVVLWLVLTRTAPGFVLRATGANPVAAKVSGRINTGRVVAIAFLCSGAIAALAGAAEIGGVTFTLYERLSPGYGYTAIAVALLARLHPLWVVPSALFFGALEAGAAALQRSAGIPSVIVYLIEAVIIIAVLLLWQRSPRAA